MWKFILFIVITAVAVWYFGLTDKMLKMQQNMQDSSNVSVDIKNEDENNVSIKSKDGTETKSESLEVDDSNNEPKTKETVGVKNNFEINTSNNSKTDKKKKNSDNEFEDVSVSSVEGNLKDLASDNKNNKSQKSKKTFEKKNLNSFVEEVKDENEYENMLMSEVGGDVKEKVSNSKPITSKNDIGVRKKEKTLSAYEKMLMDEVGSGAKQPDDELVKPKKLELSGNALRDRLKTLLISAKKVIDRDADIELVDADSDVANSVKVQTKSAKDLLNTLVASASESNSKAKNEYVANLLTEISKDKIRLVKVGKDFTTIKVRKGDTLSTIARNIYGNSSKYKMIYEANKDVLKSPNSIYVGAVLKIPNIK